MSTESTASERNPIDALQSEAKTDIGLRREENQDSFGIVETSTFKSYIVADGMGGVKGGAIASGLAIEVIRNYLSALPAITEAFLTEAVTLANDAIFQKGSTDPALTGMGTTVVMLTFTGTKLLISNVGDSRAYRVRGGLLDQLTEDHTLVNELVRAGTITEEQAGSHPVSHMLTRSLGPTPSVEIDVFESLDDPHRGDVYLLCSDGLYNMVHPEEFVEVIQSLPIEEVAAELISLANLRGGADNITVILVKIGDEYPLPVHISNPEEETFVLKEGDTERAGNARVSASIDIEKLRASQPSGESPGSAETKTEEKTEPSKPQETNGAAQSAGAAADRAAGEKPKDQTEKEPGASEEKPRLGIRHGIGIAIVAAVFTVAYALGRMNPEPPKVVVKNELPIVVAPQSNPASQSSSSSQQASVESSSSSQIAASMAASSAPEAEASSSSISAAPQSSSASVEAVAASSASSQAPATRQQVLAAQVQGIEDKLAAFDKPISGKIAENLGVALTKIADSEKKQGALTAKLQEATTRLTKWLGLKRRLEEQNPIDLANEVAELSPVVKEKQDAFQRATWAYLQQYEAWQNSSNNPALDKKVQELAQGRNDAMTALADSIKAVVDEEISKSDKIVGEVTFERDALSAEIRSLRQEVAFARTLVGNDPQARELMKNDLKVDLQRAQTELKQLEILSPPAAAPPSSMPASAAP